MLFRYNAMSFCAPFYEIIAVIVSQEIIHSAKTSNSQ